MYLVQVIIILWTATTSNVQGLAFTPEDTAFAFERCRNISGADSDQNMLWAYWKFPDKKQTHCFVKCFFEKLGLIDLVTRGLNPWKLVNQIDNEDLEAIDVEALWTELVEKLSGTCRSYYLKWIFLNRKYSYVIRNAFYADSKHIDNFYANDFLGAKRKGMNAIDFCTSTVKSEQERSSTAGRLLKFECYWQCVFKHFRYFDAYGRIDNNEVKSSFLQYNNDTNLSALAEIDACVHLSNQQYSLGLCQVAVELYNCFIRRFENIFGILNTRNIWTMSF